MEEAKKKVINGNEYSVLLLNGKVGAKAGLRFAKAMGGFFFGAMSKQFAQALAALSEEDLEYFIDIFGRSSRIKIGSNAPLVADVFEKHFSGNYLEMVKWIGFCAEVNFSDFLAGVRDAVGKADESEKAK